MLLNINQIGKAVVTHIRRSGAVYFFVLKSPSNLIERLKFDYLLPKVR